ncbi:MAG: hypothetical protein JWR10_3326 [Rubritepida sp.]|nr:hypothetical protein [Rubritepida sp.]
MASIELRVLDTRIGARFKEPRPSDIIVGSVTPLSTLMTQITGALGSDRLGRLSVCCHGYESGVADPRVAMSRPGGGFGLQLGGDDLTWGTVSAFSSLSGKFANGGMFDIYACAAAEDTSDGNGFTGNGRLLMRELAGYSGATVRASDSIQNYTAGVVATTFLGIQVGTHYSGVDFGEWEGNVWLFTPDGARSRDTAPGRGVH